MYIATYSQITYVCFPSTSCTKKCYVISKPPKYNYDIKKLLIHPWLSVSCNLKQNCCNS